MCIRDRADDIAYGVHDLEDAIVTGVVNQHQWQEALAELKTIPDVYKRQSHDWSSICPRCGTLCRYYYG